jgi:hypothetical protein
VQWAERDGFEDQQVESALQKIEGLDHVRASLLDALGI